MKESEIAFYNFLTCFFNRAGTWFLQGPSLAEFVCNRELSSNTVCIGVVGSGMTDILQRLEHFGIITPFADLDLVKAMFVGRPVEIALYSKIKKNRYSHRDIVIDGDWLFCPEPLRESMRIKNQNLTADGRFRITIDEMYPYAFCIPYCSGSILDATIPGWYLNIEHNPPKYTNDVFFDIERRAAGYDLLKKMLEAGERAGIREAMSIGFGVALGYAREGDFILWDRDMDVCVDQDATSGVQHSLYFEECEKAGLFEHRKMLPSIREDNGKFLWFSLGEKNPFTEHGVKSCQWFQFEYNGFLWHSKGGKWVDESKFRQRDVNWQAGDAAVCKGIPVEFAREMIEIDFHGVRVNVPKSLGAYCDYYYPGWPIPKANKSSAHRTMLVIGDWNDQRTWRMS